MDSSKEKATSEGKVRLYLSQLDQPDQRIQGQLLTLLVMVVVQILGINLNLEK